MSDNEITTNAIADLKALQDAIRQPKSSATLAIQSIDTYLLLHVAAVTFATGMGVCELLSGVTGISPTGDLLALSRDSNVEYRWPIIELCGAIMAVALAMAYGFIMVRSRQQNDSFSAFCRRHFEYFKNFSAVSDIVVKFTMFALLMFAGKTMWVAPLFMLCIGDVVFQARLLALPSKAAAIAGLVCIGLAFWMFAVGAVSLLWPLAVGDFLAAWSLVLISTYRHRLLSAEA